MTKLFLFGFSQPHNTWPCILLEIITLLECLHLLGLLRVVMDPGGPGDGVPGVHEGLHVHVVPAHGAHDLLPQNARTAGGVETPVLVYVPDAERLAFHERDVVALHDGGAHVVDGGLEGADAALEAHEAGVGVAVDVAGDMQGAADGPGGHVGVADALQSSEAGSAHRDVVLELRDLRLEAVAPLEGAAQHDESAHAGEHCWGACHGYIPALARFTNTRPAG